MNRAAIVFLFCLAMWAHLAIAAKEHHHPERNQKPADDKQRPVHALVHLHGHDRVAHKDAPEPVVRVGRALDWTPSKNKEAMLKLCRQQAL
jgi:hypothetical protein